MEAAKVSEFTKAQDLEQLIAGRQRDRKSSPSSSPEPKLKKESLPRDPEAEAIVKRDMRDIDKVIKIPIYEVIKVQNDSQEVERKSNPNSKNTPNRGYIDFERLARAAKAGTLNQKDTPDYDALKSAYAEAIVFKSYRNVVASDGLPLGVTIYEPKDVRSSKQNRSSTSNSSTTSEVVSTNSTPTNSQTTLSVGETAEVSQANNAKLQEILARMQTRDRSETSNNILPTTSKIGSITTTPNTATVNTTDRDTAFLIPTSQNTALTGGISTTALTGWIGTTALTGGTSTTALTGSIGTTALTGGKTQEPSQLQQGMALS
jgi:hypothetical protein